MRTGEVYDIVNAGPRHCFQAGNQIIHNCYGIGGPGIQSTLKSEGVTVSEEEARSYIDAFLEKYPKIAKFIERTENSVLSNVYSMSAFGRRRRLDAVISLDQGMVARCLRQGVNHVIQSSAGDLTNTAAILFDQEIRIRRGDDPRLVLPTVTPRHFDYDERWKRVHFSLQVHDMLGVDCHKDVAEDVVDRLLYSMENAVDLAPLVWGDAVIPYIEPLKRVPIVAEAEVGPNWRDAYKAKTGKDVAKAMHVAFTMRAKRDVDPLYKWEEKDEKEALSTFKV